MAVALRLFFLSVLGVLDSAILYYSQPSPHFPSERRFAERKSVAWSYAKCLLGLRDLVPLFKALFTSVADCSSFSNVLDRDWTGHRL